MTPALAIEYIPRRMKDLGYGENYYLRFINMVLQAGEVRITEASAEFFILIEDPKNVSVESEMGIFNATLTTINEMQYEHQGQITITNLAEGIANIHFIQIIPMNIKKLKPSHE